VSLIAIARALVVVGAGIGAVAAGAAGAGASPAAAAATSSGAQLWAARYHNAGNGGATAVAVSPDGKTAFVTGWALQAGHTDLSDYVTIAYNAATGARRWLSRYNDPDNGEDRAYSIAVSRNGETVFVTGYGQGTAGSYNYATVAYNAATGARRWVARYSGIDALDAPSVTVSPDGRTVFVAGSGADATGGYGYITIAYNAASGHRRWDTHYAGPVGSGDFAHSVAISPTGKTVFVTGYSLGTRDGYDYATVAYNAATGAQRWAKRYNGATNGERGANSVAVSPNGKAVFVTGSIYTGKASNYDYATVAYNAATGAQLWAGRYSGRAAGDDQAYSVAVSPTGKAVFVTGYSQGPEGTYDYATIAYKATTGARLWVTRLAGPLAGGFGDRADSVAVSPSGSRVYVTGETANDAAYRTVAYSAATGAQLWLQQYRGAGLGSKAFSVAVSRLGTVFVTGYSVGDASGFDYVTIAYRG
jgi:DNA-binding beta-propeller fold protein YncE